jgi:hypothetical protein
VRLREAHARELVGPLSARAHTRSNPSGGHETPNASSGFAPSIAPTDAGRAVPTFGVSRSRTLILTSLILTSVTPLTGSVTVPRSSSQG